MSYSASQDWIVLGLAVVGLFAIAVCVGGLSLVLASDGDLELRFASNPPRDAFRDKRVVIVGASSGLGEALALRLAASGARLVLSSRRVAELEKVAEECRKLGSPTVKVIAVDALNVASHGAYASEAAKALGDRVDFLILNSGRSQRALIETTAVAVDEEMFALNVRGPISLTKAFMPWLVNRKAGTGKKAPSGAAGSKEAGRHMVCVTSSVAGLVPSPCSASYSMSKHAIEGFFNTLRAESSYRGLDVLTVCPGPFESEIVQSAMTGAAGATLGEAAAAEDKSVRLSADRVAELFVRAMHHRLPRVIIGPQPILAFTWVAQYLPNSFLARIVADLVGPARTEAMAAAGRVDYSAIQKMSVLGTLAQAVFGGSKDD